MKQYIDGSGVNLPEKENKRYNEIVAGLSKDQTRFIELLNNLLSNIEIPPRNYAAHDMMQALSNLVKSLIVAVQSSLEAMNATHYVTCTSGAIDNYREIREEAQGIMKDVHKKMSEIQKEQNSRHNLKPEDCRCPEHRIKAKA